eukprot:gnl/TRDRNA2_/TRDRNA2_160637_c0_seq3.p2 gnl/TRDRNA2_/TRDRNA2_160637_c0~~gnl/TRDRNA2_/TRDRNA2_160637_c0_seq3.p2  ORF type:complete len:117 (-),score=22.42 gnl/TRDRNA2_/TRDRNA2_160637_c0_seq3:6-356(-)
MIIAVVLFACLMRALATCKTEHLDAKTTCQFDAATSWANANGQKLGGLMPASENPSADEMRPVFEFFMKGDAPGCELCSDDCLAATDTFSSCFSAHREAAAAEQSELDADLMRFGC